MKIMEEVRKFAAENQLKVEHALTFGMSEKAKEFMAMGAEIYHGGSPQGAKH